MQESRLFRIVYYLIEKGKSTAPELAQKFEVSARTIYRDIDVISSAGIPIYATQGKNGGIIIDENFTLDRSMLSKKEKEQILSGLQALFVANSNNTNELLTKLGALFHLKTTNWIEVDFSDWIQGQPAQNIFNDIKTAILDKYIISFETIWFGPSLVAASRSFLVGGYHCQYLAWYSFQPRNSVFGLAKHQWRLV